MNRRHFELGILLAFSTGGVACHKLTTVMVQPATTTLDSVNETAQLRTQQLDSNGHDMQKQQQPTWSSNAPDVASIDSTGKATAKKSGSARISAAVGSVTGYGTVEVQIPAKITAADVSLAGPGQKAPVALQVLDDAGKPMAAQVPKVKVVSADPTIATVDGSETATVTVTGVGVGQTKLTATLGALTLPINVTVNPPDVSDLTVGKATLKMKVGESQQLGATATVAGAPAPAGVITYATSKAKVATVDPDGTVHAVSAGKATITVTAGQKTATAAITVKR